MYWARLFLFGALVALSNLTLAAEEILNFHSVDKEKYFITDNVGILNLLILLIYFFAVWWCVGRDPKKGIIIPTHESPSNYSPALMRYIVKKGYDYKCLAVVLTSLAVKGAIKIEEIKNDSLFGNDITVHFLSKEPDVTEDEKAALQGIVDSGSAATLSAIAISYEYFSPGNVIAVPHYSKLFELGKTFFSYNTGLTFLGFVLALALWFFNFVKKGDVLSTSQSIIFTVGAIALIALFGWLNQQLTKEGRKILDEVQCIREYLKIGEQDFLKNVQEGIMTPDLFEKLLPYAIAFDLESEWLKKFDLAAEKAQISWSNYRFSWYVVNSGNTVSRSVAGFCNTIAAVVVVGKFSTNTNFKLKKLV